MNRVKSISVYLVTMGCLGAFWGITAMAAEYPSKPVTLIIPYSAGGSTDLTARPLANAAKKYLGEPVICENRPGGGATVGPSLLVSKPPDGYTIGLITSAAGIAWHMGKLNFNPVDQFTYIIHWARYMYGIVVRADSSGRR